MDFALLEVCVDSIESAIAAADGGAERIELCSSLSEDGLTPSPGFLRVLKEDLNIKIPIFCMLRPRGGNFIYSTEEMKQIIYDLEILKENNADGFVFGALKENLDIDTENCSKVIKAAKGIPVTFHRAFDKTRSNIIIENCELIESMGFSRLLTSGLALTAESGLENLKKISSEYEGHLTIMPGSGINFSNISKILSETGFKEFHASCRLAKYDNNSKDSMVVTTDVELVRKLVQILKQCMV